MTANKLSISLDEPLVAFLGRYQATHSVRSKSEGIAEAVRLLRERELESQYAAAFEEWEASGEAGLWDAVSGDRLGPDAPR
jgi:antitoxin ParD1/3/4